MIRKAIADCLHIPCTEIKLGRTERGKPFLENSGQEDFSFNVSHHGDYAVLAATKDGLVGVDVMKYEVSRYKEKLNATYIVKVHNLFSICLICPRQQSLVFNHCSSILQKLLYQIFSIP